MRPKTRPTKITKLNKAVSDLRAAYKETQTQFAKRVGIGVATLSRYESERNPSGRVLIRFRDLSNALTQTLAKQPPKGFTQEQLDRLYDIDDTFYAALVQEFPAFRNALCASLRCQLDDMSQVIWEAYEQTEAKKLKEKFLRAYQTLVPEARRMISLFDPMTVGYRGDGAEEAAEHIVPMLMEVFSARACEEAPTEDDIRKAVKTVQKGIRKRAAE